MNFKQATDALLESVTLEDFAKSLGISIQSVRQARASDESAGHRPPPRGWEKAVVKLAKARSMELLKLANHLEKQRIS